MSRKKTSCPLRSACFSLAYLQFESLKELVDTDLAFIFLGVRHVNLDTDTGSICCSSLSSTYVTTSKKCQLIVPLYGKYFFIFKTYFFLRKNPLKSLIVIVQMEDDLSLIALSMTNLFCGVTFICVTITNLVWQVVYSLS